jgi:hypothetical protein
MVHDFSIIRTPHPKESGLSKLRPAAEIQKKISGLRARRNVLERF